MINYGYIYKTTNFVNNKVYIGKRKLSEFDPNYFGSGKVIGWAINKYGREHFKVELLVWAGSKQVLNELERSNIALAVKDYDRENVYNITPGGDGGFGAGKESPWFGKTGENHPMFGNIASPETRKKQSFARTGKKDSPETIKKRAEANTGGKRNPETIELMRKLNSGENNPFYGKHHSPKSKVLISEGNKKKGEQKNGEV